MEFSPFPRIRSGILAAAVFLATGAANAAILARYEFTGSTLASTDDDVANLTSTAGNFGDGPGFTGGYLAGSGNPAPARFVSVDQTGSTSEAAAHTGEDYFQFTITPVAGFQLDLTSLTLDFDASYNTQPRGFGIRTSIDGYAAPILVNTEAADTGTNGSFVNSSVSLAGAGFQGLTTAITFRITVFDSASASTNNARFDNVIVNGTVTAVPEPGTLGLVGMAVLAAATARRREVR